MLEAIIVILLVHWLQKIVVGYKVIYEPKPDDNEPKTWQFKSLDDAMEYAELRKGGWEGDINDYYSGMKG